MNERGLVLEPRIAWGQRGPAQGGRERGLAWCSDREMRVHAHIAWRSSDIIVAAALRGGDAEGVCPYAVGTGELARRWHWIGPRSNRACASTPCL
jgi:hypothetical protein